jgi:hypothetical protein
LRLCCCCTCARQLVAVAVASASLAHAAPQASAPGCGCHCDACPTGTALLPRQGGAYRCRAAPRGAVSEPRKATALARGQQYPQPGQQGEQHGWHARSNPYNRIKIPPRRCQNDILKNVVYRSCDAALPVIEPCRGTNGDYYLYIPIRGGGGAGGWGLAMGWDSLIREISRSIDPSCVAAVA